FLFPQLENAHLMFEGFHRAAGCAVENVQLFIRELVKENRRVGPVLLGVLISTGRAAGVAGRVPVSRLAAAAALDLAVPLVPRLPVTERVIVDPVLRRQL